MVKAAAPDGYTLMFTNSTTMVQNKVLFKKLPYDPDKDFALVAWFNTGHLPTDHQQGRAGEEHRGVRRLGARPQGVARHLRRRLLRPCRGRDAQPATTGSRWRRCTTAAKALMWQDVASGAVQAASGSYASASCRAADGRGPADRRADAWSA